MEFNIPDLGKIELDLNLFPPTAMEKLLDAIADARGSVEDGSREDEELTSAGKKVEQALNKL